RNTLIFSCPINRDSLWYSRMALVKKILSFLFSVYYNLYAFSAAAAPAAPVLGQNVQMEAVLNVPIAAVAGVPFANANLFDPALAAAVAGPIAAAGIHAGPLGAGPAQIAVHSDTVAVDKFISYCHNASLGDFDPAAAVAAAAAAAAPAVVPPAPAVVPPAAPPAVAPPAVAPPAPAAPPAPGIQMNALINRLREFYSTDIYDLEYLLGPAAGWSIDDFVHLALAAVTVISRAVTPAGAVIAGQYDYHTFFFGDIFRSAIVPLLPGANHNLNLPNFFFHSFGQNFPTPGGPVSLPFSGNWTAAQNIIPRRARSQAHSERAFAHFLAPPPPPAPLPPPAPQAIPLDSRASLITHIPNTASIIALIVHLKNKLPMCAMCRNQVTLLISTHLRNLLLNPPAVSLVGNLRYRQPMKGVYLTAALVGRNAALSLPANRVIQPLLGGVPVPAVAPIPAAIAGAPPPNRQTVRIVFIIGSAFKNVEIFE
ncbi:MAG: hypothetical protein LBJ13_02230, partial [Puniceicoccales bacterium]|nr:hypothetical protein [Puniceicoccales bacterium]